MAEFNKNILIAVDDSENSRRAVEYVGTLLGGSEDIHITILHIIPKPEEDFFPTEKEKETWLKKEYEKTQKVLNDYRTILLSAGFFPDAVKTQSTLKYCPSLAECIIKEDPENYSTVVVGRKGRSRTEEFLLGSVSSKIVNYAKNTAVWIVG